MDCGADEGHHLRGDERRERNEGEAQGLVAHGGEDHAGKVAPEDGLLREVPGIESELYTVHASGESGC